MSVENKVAVITDTGSSIHEGSPLAKEFDIVSVPLDVKFLENNSWVSYKDTDLTPDEFYNKMRQSKILPQTSGAITGRLLSHYEAFAKEDRPVISIHITSRHSNVWESAVLGSKMTLEKYPHLLIEVVDSKNVSLGTWFLVEMAAKLANEGYPLKDINKIILETVSKIKLTASLSTFENVVKGGRLPPVAGFIGTNLQLRPIIGIVDGEIKFQGITRTSKNAQRELISRFENTKGEIVKLAVIHTNFEEGAELLRQSLRQYFSGEIGIYEAGPVLGVHAGEKSLAIITQTK
jgi:DegV family protein with EDD domain